MESKIIPVKPTAFGEGVVAEAGRGYIILTREQSEAIGQHMWARWRLVSRLYREGMSVSDISLMLRVDTDEVRHLAGVVAAEMRLPW